MFEIIRSDAAAAPELAPGKPIIWANAAAAADEFPAELDEAWSVRADSRRSWILKEEEAADDAEFEELVGSESDFDWAASVAACCCWRSESMAGS